MTAAEQGTGTLIVVVGPSGAGKDSVMGFAARHFAERPDILFVRRVITRPSDAGSEVHESVSDAEFEEMRRSGIFAVFWRAHGLSYGIPAEISEKVAAGLSQAFGKIAVVVITADLPVLARRLAERGRESEEDVLRRLTRQAPDLIAEPDVTVIDNSDRLEIAGRQFVALVERHSARSHHPA
ncbi:phosphonate metabolism protein/1,5-bisphosphokinase (PRPP-forming) PhnN [Sinorhizobium medicae]|uniref:phosphonate metabolism protein/1,5-bisphosphokinase (PRPP-forming) PhnN n=1 Tax=Sinorhizobium medicae TaxID=110321 RepID=UPI000C7CC573|nr:phosphonate metabolism protein/1,5-bisphosphokinase (PRPP-forming) PhnN [Sinorhizobium medicae]PLU10097.1 phosphonate metabolism protein/1,5-bisphosphokinase (PRPP-forming) PhnN [Sinorhizobium medicae]